MKSVPVVLFLLSLVVYHVSMALPTGDKERLFNDMSVSRTIMKLFFSFAEVG